MTRASDILSRIVESPPPSGEMTSKAYYHGTKTEDQAKFSLGVVVAVIVLLYTLWNLLGL